MDNDGNPCVHSGRIASEFFKNGMVVTFDKPCRTIERNDTLAIRTPKGETLEMFPAAVRPMAACRSGMRRTRCCVIGWAG